MNRAILQFMICLWKTHDMRLFLLAHFEKLISDKKVKQELKEEVKALLPLVDGMDRNDMEATMRKYDMKSPLTGNDLTDPIEFNLMFSTSIGPAGAVKGFVLILVF